MLLNPRTHVDLYLGQNPLLSIKYIHSLNLFKILFALPNYITSTFSERIHSLQTSLSAASILQELLTGNAWSTPVHRRLLPSDQTLAGSRARLFLGALLTPFRHITYIGTKMKSQSVVEAAIREGVKLGTQNHFLDGVPALFAAADLLDLVSISKIDRRDVGTERVSTGLLLRDKNVHNVHTGSDWASSLLFALVQDLVLLGDEDGVIDCAC